jgi:hypothetical protein
MVPGARRAVLGTAMLAVLSAPATAAAQDPPLPLEVRGVTAVNAGGGTVRIVFGDSAARLYRRVAGRTVIVRCEQVEPSAPLLLREDRATELVRNMTAPRRRRPIRVRRRGASEGFDVCKLVGGELRGRRGNRRFVTTLSLELPLTQDGAAFLRERALGDRLVAALDLVAANGRDGRYPAFADVAEFIPRLVQLATPDATPPPGAIGLFTDAAQHVTVVAVSVLGRRLFIDVNGETLSSNVPEVVAGQDD